MDQSERIARLLLERVLRGALSHYVQDQSAGQHDFDLEYPDGRTAAVEVTTSTDQDYRRIEAAMTDARKGGMEISATLCQKRWVIHPFKHARINTIRDRADALLAPIEDSGVEFFTSLSDAADSPHIARILTELHVEGGFVIDAKGPGAIFLSYPTQGGFLAQSDVTHAVEREALKPDNRRKLRQSGASERHLFVHVDHRNMEAWTALNDLPPNGGPELPDEITHVWAAASMREPARYTLWASSAGSDWRSLGPITVDRWRYWKWRIVNWLRWPKVQWLSFKYRKHWRGDEIE